MTQGKRDILIIMGRYLPGYKDGGPVRTIKNLTEYLGDEYNFKILTCDRDYGDDKPYQDIKINEWNDVGKAKVYYVKPGSFSIKIIKKFSYDVDMVYVCGCFSDYSINTLIAKRMGIIKVPVIVAAMGLFSPLEFQLKYKKKKLFTTIFNGLGMFKNIYWSASSEMEIREIMMQIKAKREQFFIAEDLPRKVKIAPFKKIKNKGELKIVWISRITPKKNLKTVLKILQLVKHINVEFSIYGTIHNKAYWEDCINEIEKLPTNVKWEYLGELESERVVETLKGYHVFLFPTLGENYGHVIQEALSAGCPCILSNQTPWKEIESAGVGYVYGVDELKSYVSAIEKYADMDSEEFNEIVEKVHQYAIDFCNSKYEITGYRRIFEMG